MSQFQVLKELHQVKAHKYGVERLLQELLPVVDNLEHALNNFSEDSTKEDKEGVELTLKSFESALDKFGIRPIYPINEQFDPVKHEPGFAPDPEQSSQDLLTGILIVFLMPKIASFNDKSRLY